MNMLLLMVTVSLANVFFTTGGVCSPLMAQGPLTNHGWDQVIRRRHLFAARPGLHLLISGDGQIHGSAAQSLYSLLEIYPVDPGCVTIRGVATARFLCIEGNGQLYSSHTYSRDDCTFREQIFPDGYNVYISEKHRALLSLGNQRQRLQGRDQGVPALAQFLPRVSILEQLSTPGQDISDQPGQKAAQTEETLDTMDLFGELSQIIQSPSFHKR